MPAHNEGAHIVYNLKETMRTLGGFGCDYEIIILDDGSTDNTLQEARNFASRFPNVHVKRNMANYGKGRAVKKAFRYVNGDMIAFLDADLDLHPGQIQALFYALKENGADVVIGSKRHPRSRVNYPWHRRIISSVYHLLTRIMFNLPVRDTQTGIKLFKYEVLKKSFPKVLCKRFAFDLELLANAHHMGYKIAEAPITLHFRRPMGRVGLKAIYYTWWDTMAIFYRMYILRYYDKKK
ncbi:glycosyltransferase [bacterium]|nr:glycosyltransferase [bacterium]